MNIITKIDFAILDFIQEQIKCDLLDKTLPYITKLADHGIVPILLAITLLIFARTRRIGFSMAIAFVCGGVVGNLFLKNVIGRIRPYDVKDVDILIERLSDFSFPSGHTLIAFETAVVLLFLLKGRKKILAFIATLIAAIIAFSRLYLYVHYPSDVLAGIVLGTIFGIIGVKLGRVAFEKREPKIKGD